MFCATFAARLYSTLSFTAIASMALWPYHSGSISPLRAVSLRPKCNLLRTHRICVPKALALYHNTRSSTHTTKALTTPTTWVDRFPLKVQPYLHLTRIDKPIGTLLLFYPCSASLTDSSGSWSHCNCYKLGRSPWPHSRITRPHPSL